MTKQQASSLARNAALAAMKAYEDVEAHMSIPSGDLIIHTEGGDVTILEDGRVVFNPNVKRQFSKSITDSIERYSAIAGPAGNVCPTCNGKGKI